MSKNVEAVVSQLVTPICAEAGVELVDVEFVKEGGSWYLRVYIDKDGGVDLDDCANVSHQLSDLLDEKDPISQAYTLEVSSPGIDRPIKKAEDFQRFAGELVRIKTFAALNGQKEFVGQLVGLEDEQIVIKTDKEQLSIPRDKAASVRLEIVF